MAVQVTGPGAQTLSKSTDVEILSPSVTFTGTGTSVTYDVGRQLLLFGNTNPVAQGMTFQYGGGPDPAGGPFPVTVPGSLRLTQIVTSSEAQRILPDGTVEYKSTSGLDLAVAYPDTVDSPQSNQVAPTLPGFTRSDSFATYLMFRPTPSGAGGSIWVPLRVLNWGWNGTVELGTLTAHGGNENEVVQSTETQAYPMWSQLVDPNAPWGPPNGGNNGN